MHINVLVTFSAHDKIIQLKLRKADLIGSFLNSILICLPFLYTHDYNSAAIIPTSCLVT